VLGLAGRGHALVRAWTAPRDGSALARSRARRGTVAQSGRVLRRGRPGAVRAWWAASLHARALVLGARAGSHAHWGALDRWAGSLDGRAAWSTESASEHFLARTTEAERERSCSGRRGRRGAASASRLDPVTTRARARLRAAARAPRRGTRGAAAVRGPRRHAVEEREYSLPGRTVECCPAWRRACARCAGAATRGRDLEPGRRGTGLLRRDARPRTHGADARAAARGGGGAGRDPLLPARAGSGLRLPQAGRPLLREAAEDLRLSLRDSVMVGDRWLDVDAGTGVGGRRRARCARATARRRAPSARGPRRATR
jgi:hypothetical protein